MVWYNMQLEQEDSSEFGSAIPGSVLRAGLCPIVDRTDQGGGLPPVGKAPTA